MIKKIIGLFICLLGVFMITSCNKNDDDENSDRPSLNIDYITNEDGTSYTISDGATQRFFQVEGNKAITVKITIEKVRGTIDINIAKDGLAENSIYEGNDLPSSTFEVIATEIGEYRVYIELSNYVGTYNIEF